MPSTIGLLVFHWITGYFNTAVVEAAGTFDGMPGVAKYLMWAVSGTGPLWFIQDLWLFSLLLLLVHKLDAKGRCHAWCGKIADGRMAMAWILLLGVLFWAGEQLVIKHPRPESADGLFNLYKPVFYFILFLMGYFVFSHSKVHQTLGRWWISLMASAVVSGSALIITKFGQDNTSPQYLGSWLNCLYGWLMCLAMMGWFQAKFDRM